MILVVSIILICFYNRCFKKLRRQCITLQSCWRKYFLQYKFLALKSHMLKLQTRVRTWLCTRRYRKAMQSVVLLQSVLRCSRVRSKFLVIKKAAVTIQSTFRMSVLRIFFVQFIRPSAALIGKIQRITVCMYVCV